MTPRVPWPGETMPLPPRVGGQRIVAAFKRPTLVAGQRIAGTGHQWLVIVEDSAGSATFCVGILYWQGQRFELAAPTAGWSYPDAVAQWLTLVDADQARLR